MTTRLPARSKSPPPPRPYHRGDLPDALLAAAEAVLIRDGIVGLKLRSIAREAGVSHTAPKHHFGDTRNLVSELAALGYRRLEQATQEALVEKHDAADRGNVIARAYVRFARDNPALFGLMFRNELIDMSYPPLLVAARRSMTTMLDALGHSAAPGKLPAKDAVPAQTVMRATVAWAYVHGLAVLLIDKRLQGLANLTSAFDSPADLVDAVLHSVRLEVDFSRLQKPKPRK